MKLRAALAVACAVAGLLVLPSAAQATANGSISGTVTESTVPAGGVYVGVIGIIDQGIFGKGPGVIADGYTDAAGHYTIADLPPSGGRGYWVCFVAGDWPFGAYDSQCFDQVDGFAPFPSGAGFLEPAPGSKAVPLLGGQHRTGVDADLHHFMGSGGGMTGRVTALGLVPLRHARVTVSLNGAPVDATFTAGNGTYRLDGLPAGSYRVCFDGSTAGHYSSSCRRALVPVRPGAMTRGISATLRVGR
jgi:hypothetical protein